MAARRRSTVIGLPAPACRAAPLDVIAVGGVAVRGDEDDRRVTLRPDAAGRLDAVHPAGQPDIHQHQIDVEIDRLLDRAVAVRHQAGHFEIQFAGERLQVPRHQQFVFDDQHARGVTRCARALRRGRVRCRCHDERPVAIRHILIVRGTHASPYRRRVAL
jgi:hypothetical protein